MPHRILRGLSLRCPACGRGRMTRAWWALLSLHERCPWCDIPFVPGRGENVGGVELAVYVCALVGMLGMGALAARGAVPLWEEVAWIAAFGVLLPTLAYRHFRGVWVGVMFALAPWGAAGDAPHVAPVDLPATPWDES